MWLLAALDRWSSYAVSIVLELAWVDSLWFPIMVVVSAAFMTRALNSIVLLDLSASRQLFTILITAVQVCVRSCYISAYFLSFLL